ncbi:hypothetical protein MBANPS3_003667 [Mucor bainieri]
MPSELTGKSVYAVSWGLQRWEDQMNGSINATPGDVKVFSNLKKAQGDPKKKYPRPTDKDLGYDDFFDDDDVEEIRFGARQSHIDYFDDDSDDGYYAFRRDRQVEKDAGYVLLMSYCIDEGEVNAKAVAAQRVAVQRAAAVTVQPVKAMVPPGKLPISKASKSTTTKSTTTPKPKSTATKSTATKSTATKSTATKSTKASTSSKKRKLQDNSAQVIDLTKEQEPLTPAASSMGQAYRMSPQMPPQAPYHLQAPQNHPSPQYTTLYNPASQVPQGHPNSNAPHQNQPNTYVPYGVIQFENPPIVNRTNAPPTQSKMKVSTSHSQTKPNAHYSQPPANQNVPTSNAPPYGHPNSTVPYYHPNSNVPYNQQPNTANVQYRPLMPYDPNTSYHPAMPHGSPMPHGPPMAYGPPVPYGAAPMPYQQHPGMPPPMADKASSKPPKTTRPAASKQKK